MCAPTHTHEHTHAKRPRTDGRRSPRLIDERARVGGPRLPATTSRTPVSSGKSTHARTPGQAYLQFSRRCADSLWASAYRTRIRCTPMLRNGGRGLLGCYGSALLSSLSSSRSPSAAPYSDKGSARGAGRCVLELRHCQTELLPPTGTRPPSSRLPRDVYIARTRTCLGDFHRDYLPWNHLTRNNITRNDNTCCPLQHIYRHTSFWTFFFSNFFHPYKASSMRKQFKWK